MRHGPDTAPMFGRQRGPDLSGAPETAASGPHCAGVILRFHRRVAMDAAPQCDRSTGSGGLATMVFVAPPRMKSRMRECP